MKKFKQIIDKVRGLLPGEVVGVGLTEIIIHNLMNVLLLLSRILANFLLLSLDL